MALQGRTLYKACRAVWQVSGSGSSGPRDLLTGRTSSLLHRWQSSQSCQESVTSPFLFSIMAPQQQKSASQEQSLSGASAQNKQDVDHLCADVMKLSMDSRSVMVSSAFSLSSWPDKDHLEYICPSEKLSTLPELVILEQLPNLVSYDLPQTIKDLSLIIDPTPNSEEISEPASSITNIPKEARRIMKIRRKKMKRHLLKKFRKRMAFTLRKIKRDRRKKKEAVFQAKLAGIRQWGESFSAKDWVQEELDKARKGGFFINVLQKSR